MAGRNVVEGYHTIHRRMYDLHESLKWKPTDNTCLRMVGVTELSWANMAISWRTKIFSAIDDGFTTAKSPAWVQLLHFICEHNPVRPIKIGYVGAAAGACVRP